MNSGNGSSSELNFHPFSSNFGNIHGHGYENADRSGMFEFRQFGSNGANLNCDWSQSDGDFGRTGSYKGSGHCSLDFVRESAQRGRSLEPSLSCSPAKRSRNFSIPNGQLHRNSR